MRARLRLCLAAIAAAPTLASAQADSTAGPAVGPPIQRITTASAVSTEPLGAVTSVRELPDGRVLLNDGIRRRLLLMDTALKVVDVVLDSLSDIAHTYGPRAGALIPFRGDTTLFVDPASYAIVVLDPEGRIVRVRSVWRVQDVSYFSSSTGTYGFPGPDAHGRIVYRIPARPAPPAVPPPSDVPYFPPQPDSAFIVAVDIDTRQQDTLAAVRVPTYDVRYRRTVEGTFTFEETINPLPVTDAWAVLADGTVAVVRAADYRIEFLQPEGTWTSSAKLPYEWRRLTDEDKERLVDSVRVVLQTSALRSLVTSLIRWTNMYAKPYPPGLTVPEGYVLPPGLPKDWILPPGVQFPADYVYACPPGVEPTVTPPPAAGGAAPPGAARAGQPSCYPAPVMLAGGVAPPPPTLRQVAVQSPMQLPDYRPPLPNAAARADLDGNLWIRTTPSRPVPGGIVYDIVSRQGELVNRLQLPPGYTLVGFGRDKVVFLSVRDATGIHLARVRLR